MRNVSLKLSFHLDNELQPFQVFARSGYKSFDCHQYILKFSPQLIENSEVLVIKSEFSAILAECGWVLHPGYEGIDPMEARRTLACSYVAQHFVDVQFGNCDDNAYD
jgi:hypothetical protein